MDNVENVLENVYVVAETVIHSVEVFDGFLSGAFNSFLGDLGREDSEYELAREAILYLHKVIKLARRGVDELPVRLGLITFLLFSQLLITLTLSIGGITLSCTPDTQYGLSSSKLASLYAAMGAKGRVGYVLFAIVDLFMFIPAYSSLLLVLVSYTYPEHNQYGPSLLAVSAALADVVETSINALFAAIYPLSFSPVVFLASIGNMMKWNLLLAFGIMVSYHLVKFKYFRRY